MVGPRSQAAHTDAGPEQAVPSSLFHVSIECRPVLMALTSCVVLTWFIACLSSMLEAPGRRVAASLRWTAGSCLPFAVCLHSLADLPSSASRNSGCHAGLFLAEFREAPAPAVSVPTSSQPSRMGASGPRDPPSGLKSAGPACQSGHTQHTAAPQPSALGRAFASSVAAVVQLSELKPRQAVLVFLEPAGSQLRPGLSKRAL